MSLLITRTRGLVSILAATVLILVPLNSSAAKADGLGTDTSLSVFTVNGTSVVDDQTVTLPPNTTSVDVVATTTDEQATRTITGDTGLVTGDNPLIVSVTAADGVTTEDHKVTLSVTALSSDTSLKTLTVNGVSVVDGEDVYLAPFTSSVEAVVETTDSDSTYVLSGDQGLDNGSNVMTVVVTAPDGSTATYSVNLIVALNTDTSLATFEVNGETVEDGSVVNLDIHTAEVDVVVETTDPDATYEISGDTDLVAGENTMLVTVTAADGETTNEYYVTLSVAFNTDSGVNNIMVDGVDVVDGEVVEIAPQTTSVTVEVETTDPDATYEIVGDQDLVVGENTLSIVVTAADGTTSTEYIITLNVARDDDTSLTMFEVNGEEVSDGSIIELDPYTESVDVFVQTTDENATYEVSGDTDLVTGDNELIVTITAADGVTSETLTIVLTVLASTDATSEISVNGSTVVDGDALTFEYGTENVEVEVVPSDENATVEISGDSGLVVGDNELSIVVTAADGSTYETTTVTITVLPNTDASLNDLQINGESVSAGDEITVAPNTTEVDVYVETTDPEATYEIFGNTEMSVGTNEVVVTVTAADQETTAEYVVTVIVPLNDDVTLSVLQVNGSDVADGDAIDLDPFTTEVEVVVETADPDATYEVEGATDLVAGENTLVVRVTAADQETIQEYTVTLNVLLNDDASLASITVNGNDVAEGDSIDVDPYTTEVEIGVETFDPDATYEVTGGTDLQPGENEVVITVTAANGTTVEDHSFIVNVLLGNDVSLSMLEVNGSEVGDGESVDADPYTTEVDVFVETTDPEATVEISGNTDLVAGENIVTVSVTAADGVTVQDYVVIVNVALGDNADLAVFQVNGDDVADGDVVELDAYTTDVEVVVETVDPDATYELVGDSELVDGENTLTVTVTAANGEVTQDYTVTLVVLQSDDTSLSVFQINGVDVADGDVIEVDPLTTEVEVVAEASDPNATLEIEGYTDLVEGDNTVVVTVTAVDGSTAEFGVTVIVPMNNDASLAAITVNGFDVAEGDSIDVDPYTTEVEIGVETFDPDATYEVTGGTDLQPGENEVVITVTAANGTTVEDHSFIVNVLLGNDVSLSMLEVNGSEVGDGESVDADPYTTEVDVFVETTDPEATVEISGNTDLVAGENIVTVSVTAADGVTVQDYVVIVNVALGDNADLAVFQVNGDDVADGDVVELDAYTTDVEVVVETVDPDATYELVGDSELVDGENTLTVTVTAANGEVTQDYTVTLVVLQSDDTSLLTLAINQNDVADGDVVELEPYTTEVDVEVETNDPNATFTIDGGTELEVGENTVVVTVTAADGETVQEYIITLIVLGGNDTTLAVFQVNGQDVQDGDQIVLDPKTESVEVVVETVDENATFQIEGAEGLTEGSNDLIVTVVAQNEVDTYQYVVDLYVPLSADTSVISITIDGMVPDGGVLELPAGTTDVDVEVETTDPDATFVIDGDHNLVIGENNLVVVVTAADGETTQEYSATLIVPASTDTSLALFQVDGQDVQDLDIIELDYNTTEVGVVVETTDSGATYEISGDSELVTGVNTLSVIVTAADGVTTYEYNIALIVPDGSSTALNSFTVNGSEVEDGDTVDLIPGTTDVDVSVETEDPNATFTIDGDFGLEVGENPLFVTVTSADGNNITEYLVILNVLQGIDTSLSVFQVNGNDVADGDVVDLEPGTTEVEVSVETTDENATFEVTGDIGLVAGENTLTVTVTAEDGETTQDYFVTLMVPANNNVEVSEILINDQEVLDGETFDLAARTTSVSVSVETVDPDATYVVVGDSGLVLGENSLVITVIAADGETTQDYTITLFVPSDDTAVTSFVINGVPSVPGDIVLAEPGTESVDVEVTTRDENAKVIVVGADVLIGGNNDILVTVVAQDGTTQDYQFVVRVGGQSADTALTSLTLNGQAVADGDTVQLPSRTTSVNIAASPRDPAATVKITGRSGLVVGNNKIEILVTAPDQITTRYIFINAVVAPLSSNTDLAEFTVNGTPVSDKGTLELAPLTRSVVVVAKPADVEAVAVVSGKSVVDGENTLTVAVTAANGTVRTYTVTLVVRILSTDSSLKSITFDGNAPVNGVYTAQPAVTNVGVVAVANSPRATVVVSGTTGLRVGANTVSVLVTAESGTSTLYKYTVNVPASNNTALKSLTVNGKEQKDGDFIPLPRGTKAVSAVAVAVDPQAKVVITGSTNLGNYDNIMVVTVTAADGVTYKNYAVDLWVTPPSSDTSLKTFKVNSISVSDGGVVTVPALTTAVAVEAAATDPEATLVVAGKSGLVVGDNTLTVTVTAANATVKTYSVTIRVLKLSSDNTLKSLKVNGNSYSTGSTVTVPFGTKAIAVEAVTNDPGATVAILGNGVLKTGSNTVTVRVTAANGAVADSAITVQVLKSSNTVLTSLSVNGVDALSGGTVNLPARTSLAVVKAVTQDPESTVSVSGTALVEGNNTVSVVITAPDASSRTVSVPVYVTPLSSNTSLSVFKVAGSNVADGSSVTVANRTTSVAVVATAVDADAVVTVAGATGLRTGSNSVVVTVVAASGAKKVYTVAVQVLKSSNTVLTSLSVNGVDALSGGTVNLPARTSLAVVKAVTQDPESTVSVSGTALVEGNNTVSVVITAPDASSRTVSVPVYVTPLSSNTSLSVFKVNETVVSDGSSVNVAHKTASVSVTATAADPEAIVTISGSTGLRTGSNTVSVVVIAVNGTKKLYTVSVVVAKSSNTNLNVLSVNGNDVADGGTVTLPSRTASAVIKAVTADAESKIAIVGGSSLASGNNSASVTVTAPDGSTRKYEFTIYVTPLSGDNSLKSVSVNGSAYVADSTVDLPIGTKLVSVIAAAKDAGAKVEVTGNTNLAGGLNNINIKVTAANGDVANYTVKVNVLVRSSNADISTAAGTWTINGVDVSSDSTVIELPAGTTAVTAAAKPADAKATILITGATGLKTGSNDVVFKVTAEDGTTTKSYTRSVTVKALSSNTNLTSLTVAGSVVVDGDTVNVPAGTSRVSVLPVLESEEARFTVAGNTGLSQGSNTVTVTVIAPSGASATTTITVVVAAPPSDTTLSSFVINGTDVVNGSVINVDAGTTRVKVSAIANDAKASVTISGKSGLVAGANTLTVTVTALSGDSTTYTVTVNVGN